MIADFDSGAIRSTLYAEICIVGAGIAGLTLAREFIGKGRRVLVIEGGGRYVDDNSQSLYSAEIVGSAYKGHIEGRFRVFGGSSVRWGGGVLPLDDADFSARDFVAYSGWPIGLQTLLPYYDRALDVLHLDRLPYDAALAQLLGTEPAAFDSRALRYRYTKWAKFSRRNLSNTLGRRIGGDQNVEVLLNAPVGAIQLAGDGRRVERLHIRSTTGRCATVEAASFVLCCGTIEVARLLLASNEIVPAGIGNQSGMVGRFFQDHVSFRAAELRPNHPNRFGKSFAPFFRRGIMRYPRFELTPEAQRTARCLGAFGQIVFESDAASGYSEMRDLMRRLQRRERVFPSRRQLRALIRDVPYVSRLASSFLIGGLVPYPPGCKWYLQVDVEQEPSPDSRVYLTDRKDAVGLPVAAIDWRIGERERETAKHFVQVFRGEWDRLGLGTAVWNDAIEVAGPAWLRDAQDTYHQAGTARMGDDPENSVVDAQLKVHGVDNLYVASCAVFPTSGSANPTFTMMALCIRLADRLKTLSAKT